MRFIDTFKKGFRPENSFKTQISSTLATYERIADNIDLHYDSANVLDYGSGLGHGSKHMHFNTRHYVESYEPYYQKNKGVYAPDYTTCDQRLTSNMYDVIISNCVLNVLPDDIRDLTVQRMFGMLTDNGRIYVNVQSLNAIKRTMINGKKLSESEVLTSRGTYQKGFTKKSLALYLKETLPDNAIVMTCNFFGVVSCVISKV